MTTTVEMLLIALAAGVFLGTAIVGTAVAVLRGRSVPVRWVAVGSGSAWVVSAGLIALVIYIGMSTTYVIQSS